MTAPLSSPSSHLPGSFRGRLPATSPGLMRRLAIAAVVAQAAIAVTGSVVRVTGSGLGCPTWPQCFQGSLVPVSNADVAPLHQWVEFGNRMLSVVLVLVAGACLLAALNTRPRRRRLTLLAAVMPAGVVAQAVVGGVTVLAGLVWWTVAPHFLLSMVLVWLAVMLVAEAGRTDPCPAAPLPRRLVTASVAVLAAVLVAGTLVTAAGPHAGDAETPRLDLRVELLTQVHGSLLLAYLALLAALGLALRATGATASVWPRYWLLVAVVLAQGALGRIQYALGVPEGLVSLHVLGAGLVTIAAASLWSATNRRVPAPPVTPHAPGAASLTRR
jgi:cytochrome c oxidase assembly protein subunit 15